MQLQGRPSILCVFKHYFDFFYYANINFNLHMHLLSHPGLRPCRSCHLSKLPCTVVGVETQFVLMFKNTISLKLDYFSPRFEIMIFILVPDKDLWCRYHQYWSFLISHIGYFWKIFEIELELFRIVSSILTYLQSSNWILIIFDKTYSIV